MTTEPPVEHSRSTTVRRLIISEILIVLILISSGIGFSAMYANRPPVAERPADRVRLNVDVFDCRPVSFVHLLTGFGTARADREVILAAQVSGEIDEINPLVKTGNTVRSGGIETSPDKPSSDRRADMLLRIDARDYQHRVEQATNRIAEAETEIEQLKLQKENVTRQLAKATTVLSTLNEEYDRLRQAVQRNVATPSDLNRALLDVQRYEDTIIQLENQASSIPHQITAAEQRLASSRSELQRAQNDLERTVVAPPFDGVISQVFVEKGQFVRAGEQLVRLTDLSRLEIPVSLSLDDFLSLQSEIDSGRRPTVRLSENETASPRWTGYLTRTAPEADQSSRTVQAFVEVDNASSGNQLLPGTFVHARIDGPRHENVLLIPREVIQRGFVYVVDDNNTARRRRIQTGETLQSMAIVTEGLTAGDRIIMTNLDIVEAGTEVAVQSNVTAHDEVNALRSPVLRLDAEDLSEVPRPK
ncbi:MAG: efflux RND transporter periplasmic adaptor subunit [Planctomycetaceae bacterium]|nr:efflux RND transporter periplasmic adaptor subunit [Planctomycetaceae bacterium]